MSTLKDRFCTPDCALINGKVEHSLRCRYSKGLKSIVLSLANEHTKDGSIIPLTDAVAALFQQELLALAEALEKETLPHFSTSGASHTKDKKYIRGLNEAAALIRRRANELL